MTREIGLYLHIPFCKSKCAYCDFPSFSGCEAQMEPVVNKMKAELYALGRRYQGARVATLYVGGGTPSLLPPTLFLELMRAAHDAFPFLKDAECSVEMNPGTVTDAFLEAASKGGINRVSLGVQSADDRLLRLLSRIHQFKDAKESALLIKKHGIYNLNLDMMLGLPTQTLLDVKETLDSLLALSPTHISCYGLIVEEGTPMQSRVQSGEWALPDEDTERAMYELARATLQENGLMQYEISNFAREGCACRHNVDCWKRREYLGVGCAACGFIGHVRYKNPDTIAAYLRGDAPEIIRLSKEEEQFESLMLGLRLTRGLSLQDFVLMHGVPLLSLYGEKLKKPIAEGLLVLENGFLRLTRRGMDVQNAVLVDLM